MAVSFLSGFNLTRTTIRLCGKFFKYTRQMVARCMSLHVVCYYAVAALHPQMTWLDPPWIRPAYCFVSVIVWTESKNVTISDRFICVILTVKQSAALAACVLRATNPVTWLEDFLTSKWPGSFTALAFAPDDLPHDLSDLEMTWRPWRPGAATDKYTLMTCITMYVVCHYSLMCAQHLRHFLWICRQRC